MLDIVALLVWCCYCSSCSTLLLLLFNIVTSCSTPMLLLVQHCYCSLFNIATLPSRHYYCSLFNVAIVPYSTLLLFLLNVTLLAWHYWSSCLTLLMFLVRRYWCSCSMLLSLLNIIAPFAQCCCSFTRSSSCGLLRYLFVMLVKLLFLAPCLMMLFLFILFHISNPPLSFLQVWEELLKFKFFWLNLKGEIFFSIFICWWFFFNCPSCFWEILVDNLFLCCVQELFGHYTFSYTHCISLLHIAFHLHNCIVYFFSTLHLFLIFLSIACKCLGWFSNSC